MVDKSGFAEIILQTAHVATDGFLITDPNQKDNPIVFVSKSFSRLTGYKENELLGRNCRLLQGEQSDPAVIQEIHKAVLQTKSFKGVLLNYKKDGTPFWNLIRLAPIFDEHQQLQYFSGIQTDITKLRHARELVLQQQAELAHFARLQHMDEMSASIFHQLKQPLSALVNYINGLNRKDDTEVPESIKSVLSTMKKQVFTANDIINQHAQFSQKNTAGKTNVCINELIEHALFLLSHSLNNIKVITQFYKKSLYVFMDRVQLLQVVLNILQNAIDAMQNDSTQDQTINISVTQTDDNMAQIKLFNNGPHIPQKNIAHLFKPFYTTKDNGTGIGLSLAHRIIELHDGKLWVESAENKGTTFYIDLPLVMSN